MDEIPVVCEGWAAVVANLSNGRRQILAFVLPGELISFSTLFDVRHRNSVNAITATCCRSFSRLELREALLSAPDALAGLASTIIDEKQRADQLISDLGQRTANGRVARLILNIRDRLAARGSVHDESFEFPLRQTHVADATGLTTIHVNRVIGEFRKADLIEIADRTLKILNPKQLQLIAEQ